jgi:dihydrodipicolinate synthase/N-acetylneuraminate lyase/fructosamine-3-kinase
MMTMSQIYGVIVPAITFFDDNYNINSKLSDILIRHILLNRANAILLFGTTGEGILFSDKSDEIIKYIDLTYSITEGKTPILVGIYGNEIETILNQMENLRKKYEALNFVLMSPHSQNLPPNDLKNHFEHILDSFNSKNHIYFYNKPKKFMNNEIKPEILKELFKFSNVKGVIDSTKNINNYKAYIELMNENFSVYCGNAKKFSTFLQMIPTDMKKFCGLVPNLANLVNTCSKLYFKSIEEDILEVHQLQEQLNDIRTNIYDLKMKAGKRQRGLKHAFLYFYKDLLSKPIEYLNIVSPELHRDIDDITKGRIEAIVNYLSNQKSIYQLYSLNKDELYQLDDVINFFSNIEILREQGKIRKIQGPLDGKVNTVYKVNFEHSQLVFRFRTSKSFRYENFVKEKVLFPFLDGTIYSKISNLSEKIKEILSKSSGSYVFDRFNPPVIPVADLVYFDETKDLIPYFFTVQQYIKGEPLHSILKQNITEDFNFELETSRFNTLFKNIGELLGKLHNEMKFDYFYEDISEIGKKHEKSWLEIFNKSLNVEIQKAKKNKLDDIKDISDFFKDNEALVEEEYEPVLLHNDFHSKNIIIKNESGSINVNGIIDFDSWGIGVRAQDFVKFKKWDLDFLNKPNLSEAFYQGYMKYYNINKDFLKKIELYSLFWQLKLTNQELNLKKEKDGKKSVDDFFHKFV